MLYAIVGMLVIILDQGVKYWVTNNIMLNTITEPLIPGVLSLVRMHNDGAAFSFLSGGGARVYFIILTGVFTVAVILALVTNFINGKFGRWCLVIVTAAGLSNCLDRILYGFVVDMFKIDLFDFAVFNVADVFITVFSLLFIIYIIFGGEKEKDKMNDEFDEFDDEEADSRPLTGDLRDTVDSVKERKGARKARDIDFEEEKPRKTNRRTAVEKVPEENQLRPMRKPKVISPEERKPVAEESARRISPSERRSRTSSAKPAETYDDPFAAWEKANEKAESYYAQSPVAKAMGASSSRSAQSARPAVSRPVERPVERPAERTFESPVEKPAERPSVERQPAAVSRPVKPAKPVKSEDEFDLDDILAEFR